MKRRTLSGLLLAFAASLGLANTPAFALSNPPAPNMSHCAQVVAGSGAWPNGAHTFRCGATTATAASQANADLMVGALDTHRRVNTEMANLAGSTTRGNFYLYDSIRTANCVLQI